MKSIVGVKELMTMSPPLLVIIFHSFDSHLELFRDDEMPNFNAWNFIRNIYTFIEARRCRV